MLIIKSILSDEQVAINLEHSEIETEIIEALWASNLWVCSKVFNSHIVKYLSLLVIAKKDKSGENTIPVISSVWPSNFYIYLNSEFPI